ncbi:MAG TPA: DUF4340 domain-containing protein [Rhodanobacteraceae bacterium]|nr:DUF4340 domain-containing protein [Rhodanobacteraceae bacterium]
MNQKTLIGLAVAALIAIVAAVLLNRSNRPESEGSASEAKTRYLVPSLRDHVNDVDKLVVTGAEGKTVATLTRGASGWSLAEKGGYAVDTGKLREFLLKLADAKLLEQKTSNKDKYATLGVEDVSGKDAKGAEVEIGGLAQPIKLIIGNVGARGGTFVRRAGEAESWLASGSLTIEKKPENWLRKDLADIAASRIASVDITQADGKSVRIAKSAEGDANFKLENVPKGREPGSDYTVNGPASMLAGLRLEDVVPAKDAPAPEKPLKARFATFDGLAIDVTAWEKDGKDYASFAASVDDKAAAEHIDAQQAKAKQDYDAAASAAKPTAPATADAKDASKPAEAKTDTAAAEPPKPEAVADPAKDREQKLVALKKEADDLDARFKDWTFVLPAYKYAAINKATDDLLKPIENKGAAKKEGAESKKAPAKKPTKAR